MDNQGGKRRSSTGYKQAQRPLLIHMQALLPTLHRKERMIADFILADPERILSSSIAEVREGSGASVGAIVGFCRRLGLEGFANFKIELARELTQSGLSSNGDGKDTAQSMFERVFQFHADSLTETLKINTEETLEEAALALLKGEKDRVFLDRHLVRRNVHDKLQAAVDRPACVQRVRFTHADHRRNSNEGRRCRLWSFLLRQYERNRRMYAHLSLQRRKDDLLDEFDELADHRALRHRALRHAQ